MQEMQIERKIKSCTSLKASDKSVPWGPQLYISSATRRDVNRLPKVRNRSKNYLQNITASNHEMFW